MADWTSIGNMLQGVGAGFSGNLPAYMAAKTAEDRTAYLKDKERRKALITDFATTYSLLNNGQTDAAINLLSNRVEHIQRLGGDPSDTTGLLERLQAGKGDPALLGEVQKELGSFVEAGMITGEIGGAQQAGMASAKTKQFVDGTVQMVLPTGQVQVILPNGQPVSGVDAEAALQRAMQNEVHYAGQKSGAMAGATQGAAYQYAAPIAGAQAQARASVEAATAPGIAAATTAATEGAKAGTKISVQQRSNAIAYDAYQKAMEGVKSAFESADTGPIAGRMPAVTVAAQTAEGARASAAPVLKQLFRSAGEGVFTDKDQQLLMDMMPDRKDHPEVVQTKLNTIDAIVKAKLSQGGAVPVTPAQPVTKKTGGVLHTDAQGNKAMVYPDGSYEEVP